MWVLVTFFYNLFVLFLNTYLILQLNEMTDGNLACILKNTLRV